MELDRADYIVDINRLDSFSSKEQHDFQKYGGVLL